MEADENMLGDSIRVTEFGSLLSVVILPTPEPALPSDWRITHRFRQRQGVAYEEGAFAPTPRPERCLRMTSEANPKKPISPCHPVAHISFVMETPVGTIYVDPVGEAASHSDKPPADLVLVTHELGDHLNNDVLTAVVGDATVLIGNAGAQVKMTRELQAKA